MSKLRSEDLSNARWEKMDTNQSRRTFLKLLGTFLAAPSVAIAELPKTAFCQTFGNAPVAWCLFELPEPLAAGRWSFSAATEMGVLITGFEAKGGETQVAVPHNGYMYSNAFVHKGLFYEFRDGGFQVNTKDFKAANRIDVTPLSEGVER